jgi:hypothetical protein
LAQDVIHITNRKEIPTRLTALNPCMSARTDLIISLSCFAFLWLIRTPAWERLCARLLPQKWREWLDGPPHLTLRGLLFVLRKQKELDEQGIDWDGKVLFVDGCAFRFFRNAKKLSKSAETCEGWLLDPIPRLLLPWHVVRDESVSTAQASAGANQEPGPRLIANSPM